MTSTGDLSSQKIPLNNFLKLLTSSGITMPDSMGIAAKIYKAYNTPKALSELTTQKLISLKIDDKDHRRLILSTIKKAGYSGNATAKAKTSSTSSSKAESSPRKRKREAEESGTHGASGTILARSLDFREVLDEEVLKPKFVHVNRAPVMSAWAMVVAQRLGFVREEALSIASVYMEMNATSKGVSLGIFAKSKEGGLEPSPTTAQPFVELMGRRIPLMKTKEAQWRALLKGEPAEPASAFSYITRSFAQTTPFVIGAMTLLGHSFTDPQELNRKGYSMYCEFRPGVEKWGSKGKMSAQSILDQRSSASEPAPQAEVGSVEADSREIKRPKLEEGVLDDYEVVEDDEDLAWVESVDPSVPS